MKSPHFKFLFPLSLFLLITGIGKLAAQDTTPEIPYPKQCLQVLKLSSDKIIFTKDKTEKPYFSLIHRSARWTLALVKLTN
nr:hypothetical protein [Elizabethkingia sp. ASV34]